MRVVQGMLGMFALTVLLCTALAENNDPPSSGEATQTNEPAGFQFETPVRQTPAAEPPAPTAAPTAEPNELRFELPVLEQSPPAPQSDFRNANWEAMRSEIMHIRKMVGVNPLAGTNLEHLPLPEGEGEAVFGHQLDQVVQGTAPNYESPALHSATSALTTSEVDLEYAQAMRATESLLEERAEKLEVLGSFEASDRLRRLARQIRQEAREAEVSPR